MSPIDSGLDDAMRALICGAGIAGLTMAWLLDQRGWDVNLVERASLIRDGGYMIDFFGPGFDAAATMGLLPRLREQAYTVRAVAYVDEAGRPRASLDYQRMIKASNGRLLSLLRGDLARVLYEGLSNRVRYHYRCTVETVDQNCEQVTAILTDGTRWTGDLLVGADGIHSTIRELAFGPEPDYLRYLGFHTAAYTFTDPAVRERVGDQFAITDTQDRAVGLYPIRDGRIAAFTVHRTPDPANPDDPRAVVQSTYADLGWVVPATLAHCPDPPALYYDQVAQIEMPTWAIGRVALVGDACHAVSLIAGQGASLAVAGAHLLASEIETSANISDALIHYQARLAPVVADRQSAGRRTADWFLPSSAARLTFRRLGLRALRVPGLDRVLSSRLIEGAGGRPLTYRVDPSEPPRGSTGMKCRAYESL